MKPEFRLVRQTIYALKRAYPQRIELRRTSQNAVDFETGIKSESQESVIIRKAILLPARMTRKFSYDLSFIAANKNFTYGGFYDNRLRQVLIDRRDVTTSFKLDLNMHAMFDGKRWEVKEVVEYEEQEVILLVLEALVGAPPLTTHNETASDSLTLGESATGVKEP